MEYLYIFQNYLKCRFLIIGGIIKKSGFSIIFKKIIYSFFTFKNYHNLILKFKIPQIQFFKKEILIIKLNKIYAFFKVFSLYIVFHYSSFV